MLFTAYIVQSNLFGDIRLGVGAKATLLTANNIAIREKTEKIVRDYKSHNTALSSTIPE